MARNVRIILVDDLDGKELPEDEAQTVTFSLNGTDYEIDLSNKNAEAMVKAFSKYTEKARKIGRAKTAQARNRRTNAALVDASTGVNPKEVRAWAVNAGLLKADSRGRIPGEVVEQYKAAQAS